MADSEEKHILTLTEEIDALKHEIDALRPIEPEREQRIWAKFRLEWNFHSNSIEGNQLTFGETKSFLLHGITANGKPLKDHLDLRGHNGAIDLLADIVRRKEPLTEAIVRELHKTILPEPYDVSAKTADGLPATKHITPGEYKTLPNNVRTVTGEIFHFADPVDVAPQMELLLKKLRAEMEQLSLPAFMLAAEVHYRLTRIHPFDDGNGRMARILMNLVLMMCDFPPVIIRVEDREEYLRTLHIADGGNLETFSAFIGERLLSSMQIFLRGAQGEEIEELSDIDKEIALLKKQVTGQQHAVLKITRSAEAIIEVVRSSIVPLFTRAFEGFSQFDSFFLTRSKGFSANNGHSLQYEEFTDAAPMRKFLVQAFASVNEAGSPNLSTSFTHGGFKFNPEGPDRYYIRIQISFADYRYSIYISAQASLQDFSASYPYDHNLSEADIEKIVGWLKRDELDWIKKYQLPGA